MNPQSIPRDRDIQVDKSVTAGSALGSATKNRRQFFKVLQMCLNSRTIASSTSVFVVGASPSEVALLKEAGLNNLTISNIQDPGADHSASRERNSIRMLVSDAETLSVADNSFDLVIAHEVLHHCASPHRALCEMLRISRRHVVILEPNDSLAMKGLAALRLTFPYELASVIANGHVSGGVRNSAIPNFIYRWNPHEILKTASASAPERTFCIYPFPYWDFNACPDNLSLRRSTRIPALAHFAGPERLLSALRLSQRALNLFSPIRGQGNKLFCCIEKSSELKPWLKRGEDRIVFDRNFQDSH
jgi:SAM-dependent methyltransferase